MSLSWLLLSKLPLFRCALCIYRKRKKNKTSRLYTSPQSPVLFSQCSFQSGLVSSFKSNSSKPGSDSNKLPADNRQFGHFQCRKAEKLFGCFDSFSFLTSGAEENLYYYFFLPLESIFSATDFDYRLQHL